MILVNGQKGWLMAGLFCLDLCMKENLTFGEALEAAKNRAKIARAGWNGKGMFVVANMGKTVKVEDLWSDVWKPYFAAKGLEQVTITPYLVMKAADDTLVMGWLASQTDMMAQDWCVLN